MEATSASQPVGMFRGAHAVTLSVVHRVDLLFVSIYACKYAYYIAITVN